MNGADVHEVGPRSEADCRKLDFFPLSVNYPVQVFFERKTGQAPRAGYRGSIIRGREPFGPRGVPARPTMLLSNRWRGRRDHLWRRRVLRDPLLAGQLCGRLNDIAMLLLSLDLGGGFSVDSICHLRDRPGFAIQRTFDELFSNAPYFADALWIVLVNRLCEHNSQLISKLLFARQSA